LSLYPNPAKDVISFHGSLRSDIVIRDLLGRIVLGYRWLNIESIDVSELPSGRYFLSACDKTIPFSIEH
jgi:hypothetical protein